MARLYPDKVAVTERALRSAEEAEINGAAAEIGNAWMCLRSIATILHDVHFPPIGAERTGTPQQQYEARTVFKLGFPSVDVPVGHAAQLATRRPAGKERRDHEHDDRRRAALERVTTPSTENRLDGKDGAEHAKDSEDEGEAEPHRARIVRCRVSGHPLSPDGVRVEAENGSARQQGHCRLVRGCAGAPVSGARSPWIGSAG